MSILSYSAGLFWPSAESRRCGLQNASIQVNIVVHASSLVLKRPRLVSSVLIEAMKLSMAAASATFSTTATPSMKSRLLCGLDSHWRRRLRQRRGGGLARSWQRVATSRRPRPDALPARWKHRRPHLLDPCTSTTSSGMTQGFRVSPVANRHPFARGAHVPSRLVKKRG